MNLKRISKKIVKLDARVQLLSIKLQNDAELERLMSLRHKFKVDDIIRDRLHDFIHKAYDLEQSALSESEVNSSLEKEYNMSMDEIMHGTIEELEFQKRSDQYHKMIMEYPLYVEFSRLLHKLRQLQKENRNNGLFGQLK
jgi:hypothetical protein